jgi:hypothetical protein
MVFWLAILKRRAAYVGRPGRQLVYDVFGRQQSINNSDIKVRYGMSLSTILRD